MKFDMKVHGIKIHVQPKFDFGLCRSKVKGHSSLNMQKTPNYICESVVNFLA